MPIKWTRDAQAEAMLKELKVAYKVETVKLSDTLLAESLKNNARLDKPIDDETVLEYAIAAEQGDAFPMPIMHRRRQGKYTLSGNHRLKMTEYVGDKTYEAYVVDTDDEAVIDDIIRLSNRKHGRRQERNEALRQALAQMQKFGYTIESVAEKFQLPVSAVRHFQRAEKIAVDLQVLGVGHASNLSIQSLVQLGRLDDNETVLRETAKVALRLGLGPTDIKKLVDAVQEERDQPTKLGALGRWQTKFEKHKAEKNASGPRQRPKRTKFSQKLRSLLEFLRKEDADTLSKLQITGSAEQTEYTEDIEATRAYLHRLIGGPHVPAKYRP